MTYTANLTAGEPAQPLAWQAEGACLNHDPELWFPDQGGSAVMAKAICADCPVLKQCRDYALANREIYGIWGATSERERRNLRRGRGVPLLPILRCGHPCTLANVATDRVVQGGEVKWFHTCRTCANEKEAELVAGHHRERFGHLPDYSPTGKCRICFRDRERQVYRDEHGIPQDAPVQVHERRVVDGKCLNPGHTRPLRPSAKYPNGRCPDCVADDRRRQYRLAHGIPLDAPLNSRGRRREVA